MLMGPTLLNQVPLSFINGPPLLRTKMEASFLGHFWVRFKGLPFHLWKMKVFRELANTCGGLEKVDPHSLARSDLRWVRILSRPTNIRSIPQVISISDGEISYQVLISVEEDGEEAQQLTLYLNTPELLLRTEKWFCSEKQETSLVSEPDGFAATIQQNSGSNFELRAQGMNVDKVNMCYDNFAQRRNEKNRMEGYFGHKKSTPPPSYKEGCFDQLIPGRIEDQVSGKRISQSFQQGLVKNHHYPHSGLRIPLVTNGRGGAVMRSNIDHPFSFRRTKD